MRVADAMTPAIATVDADATAAQAAAQMKARGVGLLGVTRGGELYGVVTDRDIAVRADAPGLDPNTTLVRELTSLGIQSCDRDASLEEAANLMAEHGVRRLIVRDRDGRSVGILSLGDLATHARSSGLVGETLARIRTEGLPGGKHGGQGQATAREDPIEDVAAAGDP
jgi:CBS domain-containing protein